MADIVAILDSDDGTRQELAAVLSSLGIRVQAYSDLESFELAVPRERQRPACVVVAANLLHSGGRGLCRRFPAIVLSAGTDTDFIDQVLAAGASAVLRKPPATWKLLAELNRILRDSPGLTAALPRNIVLDDGGEITIRGIQPEDAGIEQAFVRSLSMASKQKRFFFPVKELSPKMLHEFTHSQYPDNWALIATVQDSGLETEIGVARYAPSRGAPGSEFAVVVADAWQGRGVATHLMLELLGVAEPAGIKLIEGIVLRENRRMLAFIERLGFVAQAHPDDPAVVRVVKMLGNSAKPAGHLPHPDR